MDLEGLSTQAKVAKILVLIGLILRSVVALFTLLGVIGFQLGYTFWAMAERGGMMWAQAAFGAMQFVLLAWVIVSLWFAYQAFRLIETNDWRRGGIYGIIAGVLLGVDAIMLTGGILALVSPEAEEQERQSRPTD